MQGDRKSSQRERLLAGMVAATNREGYAHTSISHVIAEAGVSRPTFYDYFADKQDCFLATLEDIHATLLDRVRQCVDSRRPEDALPGALAALLEFAGARPAMARLLMSESLSAGRLALDARDHGIAAIEQIVEGAHRQLGPTGAIADVSPRIIVGGVYRLLAPRLRHREAGPQGLLDELLAWIESYRHPAGDHRWRALKPRRGPSESPFLPATPLRAPPALPPGRPRISEEQVAANHRQRILFAVAALAERNGYADTTITEITELAGIDGRAFYALFTDKQDAFQTVHELGFQEVMAVTAGAFFARRRWPQRSWEAGSAFTQFLEQNPTVAHVGFVEAYTAGLVATQRAEASRAAFTIFLEQGYQHAADADPPSQLALEAIITTIFEIVYRQARASLRPQISGLLGHLMFVWLAPFMGPAEANRFIGQQLSTAKQRKLAQVASSGIRQSGIGR